MSSFFNTLMSFYQLHYMHWSFSLLWLSLASLVAIFIFYIAKKTIIDKFQQEIKDSRSKFGNLLIKNQLFKRTLCFFIVALLLSVANQLQNQTVSYIALFYFQIHLLFAFSLMSFSIINTVSDFVATTNLEETLPVKALAQMAKMLTVIISALILIGLLMDKSVPVILSSVGAFSAILLIVFREVLLNMVALLQIRFQQAINTNDWIVLEEHNADGFVKDISLNGIVVLNWDNTTSVIPPSALLTNGIKNYQTIFDLGRRIKRIIEINVKCIHFLTNEEIEYFKQNSLLHDYIVEKQSEISQQSDNINGLRMTNIGTFRKYIELYLKNHPFILQESYIIVRQQEMKGRGIPIEVYCFSAKTDFVSYEEIQSDIFDHIYAIASEFGIKIFQEYSNDY